MISQKKQQHILESVRPQINTIVKRIIGEAFDFMDDMPERDKVNGPDPSAMNPGEEVLVQAIKEYCNQTGKSMYFKDFQDILIGIVRAYDTTDKIAQLKKMVGAVANDEAEERFKEPEQPDLEDNDLNDFGSEDDDLAFGSDDESEFQSEEGGEDEFVADQPNPEGEEEFDTEGAEQKMQKKKENLSL